MPVSAITLQRKSIHLLAGVFSVLLYNFFGELAFYANMLAIAAGTAIFLFFRGKRVFKTLLTYFGGKSETGLSTLLYATAILFCFSAFSKSNATASVLVLAVSDSLAAVFGEMLDRKKGLFTMGSLYYLSSSFAILVFFTSIAWAIAASLIATAIQSALRETDNLLVPIATASILEFLVV